MSDGIYAQLLPHWIEFCKARRSVAHYVYPEDDKFLLNVGARNDMRRAYQNWRAAVTHVCGADASIEWPDCTFERLPFFPDMFVEGPCLVCGVIIFNDTLQRLDWT